MITVADGFTSNAMKPMILTSIILKKKNDSWLFVLCVSEILPFCTKHIKKASSGIVKKPTKVLINRTNQIALLMRTILMILITYLAANLGNLTFEKSCKPAQIKIFISILS